MIHALDPTSAIFIGIGYVGFVASYWANLTPEGRASRAGQSMNYLLWVFILCTITSYAIQLLPGSWQFIRPIEGWVLAVASLGLLFSGCGVRLARAMQYEETLHKLDAALAEIEALKNQNP